MAQTTLHQLSELGQSVWLDYIDRDLLDSGKLKKLIGQGLRGMTSNPAIFEKAISNSKDYDEKILRLKESGKSTFEIYDELTIRDIQDATDIFRPVFDETGKLDGYVSLEINPQLANDTKASIGEGKRLFKKVNRPNVMIKVPATDAGFLVIEELLADGINVNVSLIFSLEQYVKTVDSYQRGIQRALDRGKDAGVIRSVASVFVSRVDSAVDKLIDDQLKQGGDKGLKDLKGKAAVANCRRIFEKSKEVFGSEHFLHLFDKGANIQRVLWGSTSTKNPEYSDVKYVSELIAKQTVNTIPSNTLEAFLEHGEVAEAFGGDSAKAQEIIDRLFQNGIDIKKICIDQLDSGVDAFIKSFDTLLKNLETKAAQLCAK